MSTVPFFCLVLNDRVFKEIVDNIVVAAVGEVLQLEDQQQGLISQQLYR